MAVVRVATRGSLLALTQTRWVVARLEALHPEQPFAVTVISTVGDRVLDAPLSQIGDKGLFTRELDEALADGQADLAVHSLKDLPGQEPPGLVLAAVPERADPRDALVAPRPWRELEAGTVVGTSSLRRAALLARLRPDLTYRPVRGNVDTRLKKLDRGEYGALVMAAAGLGRLGLADRITGCFDPDEVLPAPGQGALAVTCRAGDRAMLDLVRAVHDPATALAVAAERALLARLEGGCQVPLAALARPAGPGLLTVDGLVAALDGSAVVRRRLVGPVADAAAAAGLGETLAAAVLAGGGAAILAAIRAAPGPAARGGGGR